MTWDEYFLDIVSVVRSKSKDRSTKVGCVIVGPDNGIRSTGYNGFPRNVNDNPDERHDRPAKYLWTEHAERNAIYNAAKNGISLKGCTVHLDWFPCVDCMRGLIQSGIEEIVCSPPDLDNTQWGESFKVSIEMAQEAGIHIRYV